MDTKDSVLLLFPDHAWFSLKAWVSKKAGDQISLHFLLTVKKDGFYSVGYVGAPSFDKDMVEELWQPLIWTENVYRNSRT
ncbi:hypothetical protein LWM68_19005 [Niabella sp. W65]|nr:hypothetical protein [Niabella sp. W65]MCH7364662.1 hypothetical protein [Niabella sp. W65]ULT40517.1 hypothetical protein KRR40_37905 [Niabella sp. I65]